MLYHVSNNAAVWCPTLQVRVVLLCGEGRSFCSGADLSSAMVSNGHYSITTQQKFSSLIVQLYKLRHPVIALVHGAAAGKCM